MNNIWDQFPLILCINLKERNDRYEEAVREFQSVDLNRVTFYRTTRQENRNKGCIDSHMACLQYAIEKGVPYVVIFEDDVEFLDHYQEKMREVAEFIRSGAPWDVFYLGGFIFRKIRQLAPHVLQGGVLCTQAYIIKTEFAKVLLARRPHYNHKLISVDLFYSMVLGNNALVYSDPLICIQRASTSDGTWDSRDVAKSGWLGKAMVYTSLSVADRRKTNLFPFAEKMKIENGIRFFAVYRRYLRFQQKLLSMLGKTPVLTPPPVGEFMQWRAGHASSKVPPA
jgi:GR25 family glycosyltransferase involved in LPS biosynthesis